ncbi:MAG: hypothetical protein NUV49_04325 [Patescibacteria group bacterium]|nr:hypothetical protein [Patescibacteria group bacterium]
MIKPVKPKITYHAIIDEIYHKDFHLFVNVPKEMFKTWLLEVHEKEGMLEDLKEKLEDAKAMVLWDYAPFYYVWIEEFNWTIKHQAVLVHELSHFVDFALSNAGISIGYNNTEVRAYYLEYIFTKVWEQLKPLYRRKARKKHTTDRIA